MDIPQDISFYGREGEPCEGFIRAVRKAAFAAGMIRDDAWMADFASTCLDGPALRYYESLSPDIQSDWRLLRQALLARYPLPDEIGGTPAGNFSSSHSSLAAEGAALPPPQPRKGRIKVIGETSADFGYIGDGTTCHKSCIGGGASASAAVLFSYTPKGELHEIEIERSGGKDQAFGIHWLESSPSTVIGSLHHALVTAFDYAGTHRSSPTFRHGPGYTDIWNVRPDNTVWPHFGEDHSCKELRVFTNGDTTNQRFCLLVAADAGAFVTKFGSSWKPVRLLFEEI